ncbi:ImmA/IrrE family metallo-endopeptidase [Bifidobacterium tissieri]|uniref:ImmA/IrrE family metallo-endopeptidase n=1 Tax=Bifidobacterium tissieri TaxID=1630162 RepID=A0A5M9ZUX8_9BIFI|nr:ImmA/IrrE family metallo-endopeptidase [Bifidobacterium tissieri]KAA8831436.1 ImmA/IrrE family metallo-endopeptidase [Bifidobacterium tissieri]
MTPRPLPLNLHASYGDIRMQIYTLGLPVTVGNAPRLPDGMRGCYCEDTHTILIDRRITYTAKRCTLVHELIHWQHADAHCGIHETRTRREAAQRLISLTDYALAERVYDADKWLMASELNVTADVIDAYRMLLHDQYGNHA